MWWTSRPVGRVLSLRFGGAGGHPSRAVVADGLKRSTRRLGAGCPRTPARVRRGGPFLTLLRVGFTEPPQSPGALVVSYTTVSPLPPLTRRRSVFCGTVPRITPGRCYRPPCLVEPGPSSSGPPAGPRRGRPADSSTSPTFYRVTVPPLAEMVSVVEAFEHRGAVGVPVDL